MKKTELNSPEHSFLPLQFWMVWQLLFFGCAMLNAEPITITGKIVDEKTLEPIALASVFIANTTYGTTSNQKGEFSLTFLKSEGLKLIVSHVSYQTKTFNPGVKENAQPLNIELQVKEHVLDQLTITNESDYYREIYLRYFKEGFFGETRNGNKCKFLNPSIINFIDDGIKGINSWELKAIVNGTLQFKNKNLGYLVYYNLEYFRFSSNEVSYFGYPLLKDQLDTLKNAKRIIENRKDAYKGSKLHFFRSLYSNHLEEEGFEVYRVMQYPIEKDDKQDYGLLGDSVFLGQANTRIEQTQIRLSLYDFVVPDLITSKPILKMEEPFVICYINKKEQKNYINKPKYYNGMVRMRKGQTTIARLKNGQIMFNANGSIDNVYELTTIGYWSFLKMGDFLPYDYANEE